MLWEVGDFESQENWALSLFVRPLVSSAVNCFKALYLVCVTKSSVTHLFPLTNTIIFRLNSSGLFSDTDTCTLNFLPYLSAPFSPEILPTMV